VGRGDDRLIGCAIQTGSGTENEKPLFAFGIERLGLLALARPWLTAVVLAAITVVAAFGLMRLKADDSLSELFRTNSTEFKRFEEIDRRFPSNEYDVLIVVEGKDLLGRKGLTAFRDTMVDLQLADGVDGLVSMLSARGKPDEKGYAAPIIPDQLPDADSVYAETIKNLRSNDIVRGKFLSDDGTLALGVIALDRAAIDKGDGKAIIEGIRKQAEASLKPAGLTVQLTGAPVMKQEIKNAIERDQILYNGLGLATGIVIAFLFFRSFAFVAMAAVPPILGVVWSLGLLGWMGIKLNLFLNIMTPLVMVMGFADSMQMIGAIRDRLAKGDSVREAIGFAVRVVGPACVLAHGAALLSFLALMTSPSALVYTFGMAGSLATGVSLFVVMSSLPVFGLALLRARKNDGPAPGDKAIAWLGRIIGRIVDTVLHHPIPFAVGGLALFAMCLAAHVSLQPRYRLADQVPDREQAVAATSRLDRKLTGGNPVHVMISWSDKKAINDPRVLAVTADAHKILETEAGLGNVWSLDSLRRWLAEAGEGSPDAVKRYLGLLPEHLVRRFITKEEDRLLVTGRLPDIDASQIVPIVDRIDKALDRVRNMHPGFDVAVTGLPVVAARSSATMIAQLKSTLPYEVAIVCLLIGLAMRSWGRAALSVIPALFPVLAAGAVLRFASDGLEFSSAIAMIVIFGVGIDSLIHFLNRLRLEEKPGEPLDNAIRRARVLVGPAIVLTTIVLTLGLGVTMLSDLPSLRTFGIVCATALLASLIGDLVFLPALLTLVNRLQGKHKAAATS
jgi:uncharacterized protein